MSEGSSMSSTYGDDEGAENADGEDLDFYAILNVPRDVSYFSEN